MQNKKILLVINNFSFFYTHRYKLAEELSKKGFQFRIACNFDTDHTDQIKRITNPNISFSEISLHRSSLNPFHNIFIMIQILRLLKNFSPDILWLVSSKPNIFGGLAAILYKKIGIIYSISGLGYAFINQDLKSKFARAVIISIYKFLLSKKTSATIFQNKNDFNLFKSKNIKINKSVIIRGVGVDTNIFTPINTEKIRAGAIRVLFCSRLLIDKGINEFIESARLLSSDSNFTFTIAGGIDSKNPQSLTADQVKSIRKLKYINYMGDIDHDLLPNFFKKFDVFVMPSYREGLPKVALEAASCGLPIIATDVTGCREVVKNNFNGFLIEVKSANAIKEALLKFSLNRDLLIQYGACSREYVKTNFDIQRISNEFSEVLFRLNQ